jgi:hypothetical protein
MDDPSQPIASPGKFMPRIRRRQKISIALKKLKYTSMETIDEDISLFNVRQNPTDIVLGVYGIEEWLMSNYLRERVTSDQTTVCRNGTWLVESNFDLLVFAKSFGERFTFFADNSVMIMTDNDSIIRARFGRGKIEIDVNGQEQNVQALIQRLNAEYRVAENLVEWVYNGRGDTISVPLNYRKAIRAAYPWIDSSYKSLEEYIDEYMDSEASVLILIGPPGTGKTTFIKNLIHRSKANAKVAYDPKVVSEDGFFANFIADDSRFLIMEDADEFLQSRIEGNTMMHKFLNVSDGLISSFDKKLVFSTNLPNVGDIDSALMRPGRCFDVLQFRPLTRVEARGVLDEINDARDLPDGSEMTLAQLFSVQPSGKAYSRRKVGFLP